MLYSVKKYQKVSNVFKKRKRVGFMTLFQFFYSSLLSNLNVAISDKKQKEHIFKPRARKNLRRVLCSKSLMP